MLFSCCCWILLLLNNNSCWAPRELGATSFYGPMETLLYPKEFNTFWHIHVFKTSKTSIFPREHLVLEKWLYCCCTFFLRNIYVFSVSMWCFYMSIFIFINSLMEKAFFREAAPGLLGHMGAPGVLGGASWRSIMLRKRWISVYSASRRRLWSNGAK